MSRNLDTDSSQKKELVDTDKYLSNTQSAPKNTNVGTFGHYATYNSGTAAAQAHPVFDQFSSTTTQPGTAYPSDSTPRQVGYYASGNFSSTNEQKQDATNNNPYNTTQDENKDSAYTYNKTADMRKNVGNSNADQAVSAKNQAEESADNAGNAMTDKAASAKNQVQESTNNTGKAIANKAESAKNQVQESTNNTGKATANKAESAKNQVHESANNAYDRAAEATPSTEQVKATTSSATSRIGNAASSGVATVSDIVNSMFTAASNTAANVVEKSEQSIAQGTEVVKQNVAEATEVVKQNVAQGAEVVKQNHNQLAENSRTTPTTSSSESTGGALPLEKILEMNAMPEDTQEKPAKPPQPKMVYALAEDDGSVKVLGQIPEGVSKEQMDNAIRNSNQLGAQREHQSTQQEAVSSAKEQSDSTQHRVLGSF